MTENKDPWGNNVIVEFEDGIAWVHFNRPDKRNAMNPKMNAEMRATVEALATDERCEVFVLTGKGDSFAAGMDLQEYFREVEGKSDLHLLNVRRVNEEWQWRWLRDYPKPTIAMVNGWCFGGAFGPMVACDLAFAADEAVFGLSEVNWGIVPAGNAPKAAVEAMGYRQALYYAMTGESFDGQRAAETGLVNESMPRDKLKGRVREVALELMKKNPTVLRNTKLAVKRIKYMDWEVSADYLYAKYGEALQLGGAPNKAKAMKGFLDDKKYRPGLESYVDEDTD